jgi:hypothetical protein
VSSGTGAASAGTDGPVHASLYANAVFLAAYKTSDERDVLVATLPDLAEMKRVRQMHTHACAPTAPWPHLIVSV